MATRDELQRLVDDVSILLGAPATLESREFDLIAFRAHDLSHADDIDSVRMHSILGRGSTAETRAWFEGFGISAATGPVRTPAEPVLGILTRLCLPVHHDGELLGYVWLLDEGRTDVDHADPVLIEAMQLVDQIGAALVARGEAAGDLEDVLVTALTAKPGLRAEAIRIIADYLGGSAAVVVVDGVGRATGMVQADIDGRAVSLVPLADAADEGPVLRVTGSTTPAGVGGVFTESAGLGESYRQALFAARVAGTSARHVPARWADLGFYRLLIDLTPRDPAVAGLIESLALVPALSETAEVYLDHAGNVQSSAARLHIHRQSLYHRLTRIEEVTGLDLSDGRDRLLLHLAVKLARLTSV